MSGHDLRDSAEARVAAAYDSRATEYVEIGGRIEQMDDRDIELIRRWRDETPGMLLDAGCGPGHWTRFLSGNGRDVIGVDISAEFLRTAGENHPSSCSSRSRSLLSPRPTAPWAASSPGTR